MGNAPSFSMSVVSFMMPFNIRIMKKILHLSQSWFAMLPEYLMTAIILVILSDSLFLCPVDVNVLKLGISMLSFTYSARKCNFCCYSIVHTHTKWLVRVILSDIFSGIYLCELLQNVLKNLNYLWHHVQIEALLWDNFLEVFSLGFNFLLEDIQNSIATKVWMILDNEHLIER